MSQMHCLQITQKILGHKPKYIHLPYMHCVPPFYKSLGARLARNAKRNNLTKPREQGAQKTVWVGELTFGEPWCFNHLAEAAMSATAPGQSKPSIRCWASAASSPSLPRYKLHCRLQSQQSLKRYWASIWGDFTTLNMQINVGNTNSRRKR